MKTRRLFTVIILCLIARIIIAPSITLIVFAKHDAPDPRWGHSATQPAATSPPLIMELLVFWEDYILERGIFGLRFLLYWVCVPVAYICIIIPIAIFIFRKEKREATGLTCLLLATGLLWIGVRGFYRGSQRMAFVSSSSNTLAVTGPYSIPFSRDKLQIFERKLPGLYIWKDFVWFDPPETPGYELNTASLILESDGTLKFRYADEETVLGDPL